MTKLWIMSDLHLEGDRRRAVADRFEPSTSLAHDVVVLAGDIYDEPTEAIRWAASRFGKPVVYICGNHEFYGGSLQLRIPSARRAASETEVRVHFLENEAAVIDGVRFLGCTLWTDFDYLPGRERNMAICARNINDHHLINGFPPSAARDRHLESVIWLQRQLDTAFDGPTVVVTHHLPSARSVADRFADDPTSAAFASRLDSLIERYQPDLWIHGHTHDACDYAIGRTRIVCNPRGYGYENRKFRSDLVVEVGT